MPRPFGNNLCRDSYPKGRGVAQFCFAFQYGNNGIGFAETWFYGAPTIVKKVVERSRPGRGSVWLERLLWEQEVTGSSPVAPIKYNLAKCEGCLAKQEKNTKKQSFDLRLRIDGE